jgi:hypothetical protein
VAFEQIPFVKDEWEKNPRPPLPSSATLTEEEATIIIQSTYRGYQTRCHEDVQLFRQWQRGFRKEIQAVITIQRAWREYIERKINTKTDNDMT